MNEVSLDYLKSQVGKDTASAQVVHHRLQARVAGEQGIIP